MKHIINLFDEIANELDLAFILGKTLSDTEKNIVNHLIIAIAKLAIVVGLSIKIEE